MYNDETDTPYVSLTDFRRNITVADLKEFLRNVPDNTEVAVCSDAVDTFVNVIEYDKLSRVITLIRTE